MLSDGPPPVSAAQHARNRRLVRDALAASGVLDKLRAQIRSSVAHEVLHRSPPDDKLIIDDRTRAMDSLVFSYLAERGLELAASVMLAECGLGTANAVLSENGIVAVLGMGKLDGHGTTLEKLTQTVALRNEKVSKASGPTSTAGLFTSGDEQARSRTQSRTGASSSLPELPTRSRSRSLSRSASKTSLSQSKPSTIAIELIERAFSDEGLARSTVDKERAKEAAVQVDDRKVQFTSTSDLPPLHAPRREPPRQHKTRHEGHHHHSHPHRNASSLSRSESENERESYLAEIRRLRDEVDGLRRTVLDDAELTASIPGPRERINSAHSRSSWDSQREAWEPRERREPPSTSHLDVTGLFDDIGGGLDADFGRRSKHMEREIRTSAPEEDEELHGFPPRSESERLSLDPEVEELMREIRRRERYGFESMM